MAGYGTVLLRSAWRLSDGLGMAALHALAGRSERLGSGILELKVLCWQDQSVLHTFMLSCFRPATNMILMACLAVWFSA